MFRNRILVLLLSLPLSFVCAQQNADPIASIESALRRHQLDQALTLAESSLKKTPADFRIWTLKGIALSMKGDNPAALSAFSRALTLSPQYPAALKGEAQLLFQTGDKRAAPLLEKIVRLDPGDQTAQEMLALMQAKADDCPGAIKHFALSKDAIHAHPASLERYGYCLTRLKQFEEAIPVFAQLVAIAPDHAYARYDLALVQMLADHKQAAIQTLEPLISAHTSDADVLSLAAEAYEAVGDTPNAVVLLRQAIVIEPTNAGFYTRFAFLCFQHDSDQVGIDMLNAGLQRISNDPSLYVARGLLYSELAQYDKAETDFQTAERLDPAKGLSGVALSLSQVQSGHPDQALATIRSQLSAHPDDPSLQFLLAKVLMDQGPAVDSVEFKQAMHAALAAVRLKPDLVAARDLLAGIYLRSGQPGLAIEQCRLALQTDPQNQSAYYHLIIASRTEGNKAEIQELVKRLSELQQDARRQEISKQRYKLIEQEQPSENR
jgi:tetratricopeptide (TPR) repeat protein